MYSADRWVKNKEGNVFTYQAQNDSELEIVFNNLHTIGQMKFDNWWVSKDAVDELITALQQIKEYMN